MTEEELENFNIPKSVLIKKCIQLEKQLTKKDKRIAELEAQIEKMKCCFNCKHSRTVYEHCKTDKHEKWEIKEK